MLTVFAATDGIQVRLGAASVSPVQVVGSYGDIGDDDSNIFRRRPLGFQTNGTTPVEILTGTGTAASAIDWLSIKNPNVANVEVIIDYEIGGTLREFKRVVLAQQETLEYRNSGGWVVLTSVGSIKTSFNQGANAAQSGESITILAADVINANATANTLADITGLLFPVNAGVRYAFEAYIRHLSAATTTGARFTINGPTFDELAYDSDFPLTATSQVTNRSLGAYDLPAAASTSSPQTTLGNIAKVSGMIRPTATGNVQFRFASEILSSAITAKAGSFVKYWVA